MVIQPERRPFAGHYSISSCFMLSFAVVFIATFSRLLSSSCFVVVVLDTGATISLETRKSRVPLDRFRFFICAITMNDDDRTGVYIILYCTCR